MGKQPPGPRPYIRLGPAAAAARVWPADQYAHLPPEDRDLILTNLALAGVRLAPSHAPLRPSIRLPEL